jgi:hypothetical protein
MISRTTDDHAAMAKAAGIGPSLVDLLASEMPDKVVDDALGRPRDCGRPVEL